MNFNKLYRISVRSICLYQRHMHRHYTRRRMSVPLTQPYFIQSASFGTENEKISNKTFTGLLLGGVGIIAIIATFLYNGGSFLYNTNSYQLQKGEISKSQAIEIKSQSIWKRLTSGNLVEMENKRQPIYPIIVDRSTKCESADVITKCFKPYRPGLYGLTGSQDIGKTVVCKQIFNKIRKDEPAKPMVYINLEGGKIENLANALNPWPDEISSHFPRPPDHTLAFIDSLLGLRSTILEQMGIDGFCPPVIVFDAIGSIPESLWIKLAYFAKEMVDNKCAKVVFIASDGRSRERLQHPKLVSRGINGGLHEIFNRFDIEDFAKSFGMGENNDSTKILHQVTDGRIGFAVTLMDHRRFVFPKKGDLNDEEKESLREHLLDGLFELVFMSQLVRAGKKLEETDKAAYHLFVKLLRMDDDILTSLSNKISDDSVKIVKRILIKVNVLKPSAVSLVKYTLKYDSDALQQTLKSRANRDYVLAALDELQIV